MSNLPECSTFQNLRHYFDYPVDICSAGLPIANAEHAYSDGHAKLRRRRRPRRYDTSIQQQIFKLSSFLEAGRAALKGGDLDRAERYFEWAVHYRLDAPSSHEGLGDYYVAAHNMPAAKHSYEAALQRKPNDESVARKLAKLSRG